MPMQIFGFRLGPSYDVEYIVHEMCLVSMNKTGIQNKIYLRVTMSNLLTYLLTNATEHTVSDDELLSHVWESNGLRGSRQRLLQVTGKLKDKLSEAGLSEDIFFRISGKGFQVKSDLVMVLYCKRKSDAVIPVHAD